MIEQDFLLYVKDLTKVFIIGGRFLGVKLVAVNKESFSLPLNKPEIFTIAGETGSGKTTLATSICYNNAINNNRCLYTC
jgi:peptide/nickel transport system ATP-binding protein